MKILANKNRVDIKDVQVPGYRTRIDFVYDNRVLVWQRMIELTLPQFTKTFNLATWIKANNPRKVEQVTVTNHKIQPTMVSGNLSGLDVTLINNGEFQGTGVGSTAVSLSSPIRLINNGWIRGSGGNGRAGSNGRAGGQGGTSGAKAISWTYSRIAWSAKGFSNQKYKDGRSVSQPWGPWRLYGKCDSWLKLETPWGTVGAGCTCNITVHGIPIYLQNKNRNGRHSRYIGYSIGRAGAKVITKYHTIPGHAGGCGGAAGRGGAGGTGQYFRHSRTSGSNGTSGGAGCQGGVNTFRDTNGYTHQGHRGGHGASGTSGAKGGDGGTWGKNGGNGGSAAGKALTGKSKLKSGSKIGHTNGSVI